MVLFLAALLAAATPQSSHAVAACCDPASMAQFASDPKFIAAHFAPLPFEFRAKAGKNVTFPAAGGAPAHGFYVPPKPGNDAAIVMVHEYWGLNDYIKQEAEKLNSQTGYAVLAVDMYDGKITDDPKKAGELMAAVNDERAAAIADGGLKALEHGKLGFKPKKIGTVGYCFGGGWSERTAILGGPNVEACVVYYGMPDVRPASLQRLKAPVLMFQGKQDNWINDKVVADFAEAMKAAGKSLEVHAYDAPHAFANPSNPKYNPSAAADSHARELAFFKAHL